MRKRAGVMALAAAGALAVGGTYAKAADFGVVPTKLIVVNKPAASVAKAVFVAKDAAVTKGAGTDAADISVTLDAHYDNGVDSPTDGQWTAPEGAAEWIVNKDTVAKYVNKLAPAGNETKVVVIKPANLIKLVGKGVGGMQILLGDQGGSASGSAVTRYCIDNGGVENCFCSNFPTCSWKAIAADTGGKLVCKGGTANPTCAGFCEPPTPATGCGPGGGTCVSFVTGAAGGTCGSVRSGGTGGTIRKSLTCGGLNVGGGNSTVGEGPTPGGAQTLLNVSGGPATYTVTARTAAATGSSLNCSDTGCSFGPFLPISNSGTSTCVHNTFASPASGTLTSGGVFTGSFPLSSAVYLTTNAADPCPRCLGGCPGIVGSGTCQVGWASGVGASPTEGDPCTPTDSAGSTYDCVPPAASGLPSFPVGLTPITTGSAFKYDAGGLFCPSQANAGAFGCSNTPYCHGGTRNGLSCSVDDVTAVIGCPGATCPGCCYPGNSVCPSAFTAPDVDYIDEIGSATPLGAGQTATTLSSVFCIPSVGGSLGFLINGAANLPGPGATSLPGTFDLLP